MNQFAISLIREYRDECLFEPKANWEKQPFIERCYSRWAADEILSRLYERDPLLPWEMFYNDYDSPIDIIAEFIDEISSADAVENERVRSIFQIAKETAEDILGFFL